MAITKIGNQSIKSLSKICKTVDMKDVYAVNNVILAERPEPPPPPISGWVDRTDNTWWIPDQGDEEWATFWTGSVWCAGYWTWDIHMHPRTNWNEGFRPTKIRITAYGCNGKQLSIAGTGGNYVGDVDSFTSEAEYTLTWGGGDYDLAGLYMGSLSDNCNDNYWSKIEFYIP